MKAETHLKSIQLAASQPPLKGLHDGMGDQRSDWHVATKKFRASAKYLIVRRRRIFFSIIAQPCARPELLTYVLF